MFLSGLGLLLTPLDVAMGFRDRMVLARAPKISRKIIVVVGAPRSGTSLTARVLLNSIPFGYMNNLSQLFPRSPLTANRWFGRFLSKKSAGYTTYYGKSNRLGGFNDALYIWDRWLGSDRSKVPDQLTPGAKEEVQAFFGTMQVEEDVSTLCKVNRLNTCAHLVGDVSQKFHFICLNRDPVNLAQSLFIARKEITGSMTVPYGTSHRPKSVEPNDIVQDVCDQVHFHQNAQTEQQRKLGSDRFWIVDYEAFCRDPNDLVRRVCNEVLKIDVPQRTVDPFQVSDKTKVSAAQLSQIKAYFSKC
ncbi:MAG: sulfotransferase [Pseudomonadota bacterium]